jgi:hypothetical protein
MTTAAQGWEYRGLNQSPIAVVTVVTFWAITTQVHGHLSSNIAAHRAQILFSLDCPCRASGTVPLVSKYHVTDACSGCNVRRTTATTAPQSAWFRYWAAARCHMPQLQRQRLKQSSASCTVTGTSGDRRIRDVRACCEGRIKTVPLDHISTLVSLSSCVYPTQCSKVVVCFYRTKWKQTQTKY